MKSKVIVCIIMLIGAFVILITQKAKVKYVDTYCPTCESTEILDYGQDCNGDQKCYCWDCGQNFTIMSNN